MKTLAAPATVEVEIKRSRFVAHASRVDSLADTLNFYESVADPGATHNCWAWKLEHRYRFNDDGEPASSAGKPIFAAIDGKELTAIEKELWDMAVDIEAARAAVPAATATTTPAGGRTTGKNDQRGRRTHTGRIKK